MITTGFLCTQSCLFSVPVHTSARLRSFRLFTRNTPGPLALLLLVDEAHKEKHILYSSRNVELNLVSCNLSLAHKITVARRYHTSCPFQQYMSALLDQKGFLRHSRADQGMGTVQNVFEGSFLGSSRCRKMRRCRGHRFLFLGLNWPFWNKLDWIHGKLSTNTIVSLNGAFKANPYYSSWCSATDSDSSQSTSGPLMEEYISHNFFFHWQVLIWSLYFFAFRITILPRKQKGSERLRNGRKFITETAMFHQYLLITRIFRFVARSVMRTNNSFTLNLSSSSLKSYERQRRTSICSSSQRWCSSFLLWISPICSTLLGRLLNIFRVYCCCSCSTADELVFRVWMELISLHDGWILHRRLWGEVGLWKRDATWWWRLSV